MKCILLDADIPLYMSVLGGQPPSKYSQFQNSLTLIWGGGFPAFSKNVSNYSKYVSIVIWGGVIKKEQEILGQCPK